MKKKMVFFSFVIIIVIFMSIFFIYIKKKEYYIEKKMTDGQKELNNPARGFYKQLMTNEIGLLPDMKKENIRLVLAAFDILEYRNSSISIQKLQELENFLKKAEELELEVIFRAAYGFTQENYHDADSMDRIEEHILQIAPILNKYKKVIYCVQAGFLGPWGEWHSSAFLEDCTKEEQIKNRNRVLKQLLMQLDSSIILNVRRPRFIRDAEKAGIMIERIGFHNDGLLASENDLGTYDDKDYNREAELLWLQKRSIGINGGEMPISSKFTEPITAIKEFADIHLSYLNCDYNIEILSSWKEKRIRGENAYQYIKNRLGYRIFVPKVSYQETWRKGVLTIWLENKGFSSIPERYEAELLLKSERRFAMKVVLTKRKLKRLQYGKKIVFKIKVSKYFLGSSFTAGIRLYDKLDPRNEIEFANKENNYKNGVNYILEVIR